MSVSADLISTITKKTACLKKISAAGAAGSLVTGAFCLFDFANVPGAFKLERDTAGKLVEGVNWKSGLKELGKSAVKCVSYIKVPAMIVGMASGTGAIIALLASAASLASSFALPSLFEEILPSEQKLVAEACKEKGVNYNPESLSLLG